jgi:phosphohistidine phosphatase
VKFYVIRHGDYAASDPEQSLTPKGILDMRRTAFLLKEKGACGVEIWHSPKKRAFQSACILQESLGSLVLKEKEALNPDSDPQEIVNDFEGCGEDRIIVSHLPLIPRMLAKIFLDRVFEPSAFPTSSVALIERDASGWKGVHIF